MRIMRILECLDLVKKRMGETKNKMKGLNRHKMPLGSLMTQTEDRTLWRNALYFVARS